MIDFEERKKHFQKGFDVEESRRRREESDIVLRKKKRNEHVAKKRAMLESGYIQAVDSSAISSGVFSFSEAMVPSDLAMVFPQLVNQALDHWVRLQLLCEYIETLGEIPPLRCAVSLLRQVLSLDQGAPIDFVGGNPVVGKLVSLLGSCLDKDLVFEVAWILTNLATGSSSTLERLVAAGVIDASAAFFKHEDSATLDQIVWLLSNIAGENVHYRNLVITAGVGDSVIRRIESNPAMDPHFLANLCWLLSNLCRGKPNPPDSLAAAFFRVLPRLTSGQYGPDGTSVENPEVISNICWIIVYLADANARRVQELLDLKLAPVLVNWLGHKDQDVVIPTLRAVGNILTGSDLQTQTMLELKLLDALMPLIVSTRKLLIKESLWALSNVMAGSIEQVREFFTHPIFNEVVKHSSNHDFELKKEAVWCICNAFRADDAMLVMQISRTPDVLENLVDCLEHNDSELLMVVLKGLNSMFKASKKVTTKADGAHELEQKFDELEGLPRLERLQHHSNPKVYDETVFFMREHFCIEEISDENDLQNRIPEGGFSFA
jgi:hypothetical protein